LYLNPELKPGVADAVVRQLPLRSGERIVLVKPTTCRKPQPLDVLVVTTHRVLGLWSREMAVRQEVDFERISRVATIRPMANFAALVVTAHGVDHQFGVLGDACDDTVDLIERLRTGGEPDESPCASASGTPEERYFAGTAVIGRVPTGKGYQAIRSAGAAGERPWLVIHDGTGAGALAAFDDRVVIAKAGGWTGFMAGATGGGRVTTIPFSDITGIEYNSGLINGVLEILTASYSGSGNQDFWRGSNKSFNANSGNPFALSNTLPLGKVFHAQAAPHLVELQQRIARSKQVVVHAPPVAHQPTATESPLDKLSKLAELRDVGALTAEEFEEQKAKVLREL
jgi:hypothetical protein